MGSIFSKIVRTAPREDILSKGKIILAQDADYAVTSVVSPVLEKAAHSKLQRCQSLPILEISERPDDQEDKDGFPVIYSSICTSDNIINI